MSTEAGIGFSAGAGSKPVSQTRYERAQFS